MKPLFLSLLGAATVALAACASPTAAPAPTPLPPAASVAPAATALPAPPATATSVPPTQAPAATAPATATATRAAPTATSAPPTAVPTAAPRVSEMPAELLIPQIKLAAPVQRAKIGRDKATGQIGWQVPDGPIVGWHDDAAKLGESGNIVLSGHHNIEGKIFERVNELVGDPARVCSSTVNGAARNLKQGVQFTLRSAGFEATYEISDCKLLLQRGVRLEELQQHGSLIQPTQDNRVTLVTCWPAWDNSHRLVVIAKQISLREI